MAGDTPAGVIEKFGARHCMGGYGRLFASAPNQ
jgi:hypothetical protein